MDSPNPYQSPVSTGISRVPSSEMASDTFRGAVLQGIRLGLKWITIIIGPVAVVMLVLMIIGTLYRLCSVEGPAMFADPDNRRETLIMFASPFGLYLSSCLWGIIGGLLICVPRHLVRRITQKRMIVREGSK